MIFEETPVLMSGVSSVVFSNLHTDECRVNPLRIQKQIYVSEDKELSKAEYLRLLNAVRQDRKLLGINHPQESGFAASNTDTGFLMSGPAVSVPPDWRFHRTGISK